jgi:serine protease inhibitor
VIELKKAWHMALAGFLVLVLLAGCTPAPTTTEPAETTPPISKQAVDLMANIQSSAWQAVSSPPDSQAVNAVNRFSMALLRESVRNEGNILISPASVFLALAMTLNGADNETRDAMLQVLAEKDIPVEAVNQASQAWIARLTQTGKKTSLEVANSIWFDQGFVPDQAFLQTTPTITKPGPANWISGLPKRSASSTAGSSRPPTARSRQSSRKSRPLWSCT